MDMGGYIRLWRQFLDWEWYSDDHCKSLFLHCLLKANYKDKRWRGKVIERGQFFTSTDSLSMELRLTPMQIRRALDKLISTGEITKKGTSEGTYITVCKYDNYQINDIATEQTDNKPITNEEQTSNKRVTTTNNNKNIKKDNNYKELFDKVISNYNILLPEGFYDLILEWLKYKSEKRQGYTETGLKSLIIKFINNSEGNIETARSMILYSTSNNYNGIFKENNYGRDKKNNGATPEELAAIVSKHFASDR